VGAVARVAVLRYAVGSHCSASLGCGCSLFLFHAVDTVWGLENSLLEDITKEAVRTFAVLGVTFPSVNFFWFFYTFELLGLQIVMNVSSHLLCTFSQALDRALGPEPNLVFQKLG